MVTACVYKNRNLETHVTLKDRMSSYLEKPSFIGLNGIVAYCKFSGFSLVNQFLMTIINIKLDWG